MNDPHIEVHVHVNNDIPEMLLRLMDALTEPASLAEIMEQMEAAHGQPLAPEDQQMIVMILRGGVFMRVYQFANGRYFPRASAAQGIEEGSVTSVSHRIPPRIVRHRANWRVYLDDYFARNGREAWTFSNTVDSSGAEGCSASISLTAAVDQHVENLPCSIAGGHGCVMKTASPDEDPSITAADGLEQIGQESGTSDKAEHVVDEGNQEHADVERNKEVEKEDDEQEDYEEGVNEEEDDEEEGGEEQNEVKSDGGNKNQAKVQGNNEEESEDEEEVEEVPPKRRRLD